MKVAIFSTKAYDRPFLDRANESHGHELVYFEPRLTAETVALAAGFGAICAFCNDELNARNIRILADGGTRLIALRAAGFNNVDLSAAADCRMKVVRVPAYSPHAVAEHTVALVLTLNRKIHRAFNRIREGNFALDGLMGFDLFGRTVGVIGTGRIGAIVANILHGFGCRILAYDPFENPDCRKIGVRYVQIDELLKTSDIITLHCPLTPQTFHIIGQGALDRMKDGVMLINTSRAALIDTKAAIAALKSGKLSHMGLDVYEEEADLFYRNLSDRVIQDDVFSRLLTFPNVLVTGHQAFFTKEAMDNIAETTISSISAFERNEPLRYEITKEQALAYSEAAPKTN